MESYDSSYGIIWNHGNVTEVIFTVIFYETGLFDGMLCEVDTGGGWSLRTAWLVVTGT